MGIFQFSDAMTDPWTRTAGFLSMAFSSVSILYGCICIARFSSLSTSIEDGTTSLGRQVHEWVTVSDDMSTIDMILMGCEERCGCEKIRVVERLGSLRITCHMDYVVSVRVKTLTSLLNVPLQVRNQFYNWSPLNHVAYECLNPAHYPKFPGYKWHYKPIHPRCSSNSRARNRSCLPYSDNSRVTTLVVDREMLFVCICRDLSF
jgi:hypothetical protein